MLITLLSLAAFALLAGVATVYAFATAKNGHQDDQGFHLLRPAVVTASRPAPQMNAARAPLRSLVSASQA